MKKKKERKKTVLFWSHTPLAAALFPAVTVFTEGHIQPSPARDTHLGKKSKTKPSLVWNEKKCDFLTAVPL